MHHNIQNKGERGVAIYVSSDLESIFVESASHGPEFVFIKLEIEKGHYIVGHSGGSRAALAVAGGCRKEKLN